MAYHYPYDEEEKEYRPPKLQTNRSMWKLMILSTLTLGIYGIMFFIPFSFDLDKIDPKREREKTMNYAVAFILALFTFSIVVAVWHHHVADHIDEALKHRNIDYEFDTSDFWKWYFFGSYILIGPFIYFHRLCTAMNLLCQSYNENPMLDESF